MSYYDPSPPDPAVQLPHKIAAKEQRARNQIRELLKELPEEEAVAHRALIDGSEAAIEAKKAEDLKYNIEWDKVPGELKNIIYKYLMTQQAPIQPNITRANSADREVRTFDLGANLLRCNKSIFEEAQPILLGDNVFELNHYLQTYLGRSAAARRKREPLIHKLICNHYINTAEEYALMRFDNLKELTIIADTKCHISDVGNDEGQWENESAANARSKVCDKLRQMIHYRRDVSYHIIYEHRTAHYLYSQMVAYRWRVTYDRGVQPSGLKLTLLNSNRYDSSRNLQYPKV